MYRLRSQLLQSWEPLTSRCSENILFYSILLASSINEILGLARDSMKLRHMPCILIPDFCLKETGRVAFKNILQIEFSMFVLAFKTTQTCRNNLK